MPKGTFYLITQMLSLSDFNHTIQFYGYLLENLKDYDFCFKRWPNETFKKGKDDFYNYFNEKLRTKSPAEFLFSIINGKPFQELKSLFNDWCDIVGYNFEIDPFSIGPLSLFIVMDGIAADDINTIFKSAAAKIKEYYVKIWTENGVTDRFVKLWSVLDQKEKSKFLKWGYKELVNKPETEKDEALKTSIKSMKISYGF